MQHQNGALYGPTGVALELTAVPAVTLADSGKVPGLLTSGSLFHRHPARQLAGHRAQKGGHQQAAGGRRDYGANAGPTVQDLSPLSTSDHSSCRTTGRISCLWFAVISFRSFRSFVLS